MSRITSEPKSWWVIYTEALLNSRGLESPAQLLIEELRRRNAILRDIHVAIIRNQSFRKFGGQR